MCKKTKKKKEKKQNNNKIIIKEKNSCIIDFHTLRFSSKMHTPFQCE